MTGKVYCMSSTDGTTHRKRLRSSFADGGSVLQNLVDVGLSTLLAEIGVPRADIGEFPAGVALVGSRRVLGCLVAHSRAVIDQVVLEITVVSK